MKNKQPYIYRIHTFKWVIALIIAIITSCTTRNNEPASAKNIIVTIEPQKAIVSAIAGNEYNVEVLMPAGANHESYEPTPQDIAKLGKAGFYFSLGLLDFEKGWVDRFSQQFPDLKIINTSVKSTLIGGHIHEHEGEEHHQDNEMHGGTDPHIWLSIAECKNMALVIKESLQKADPGKAGNFEANYLNFIKTADSADSAVKVLFANLSTRSFMIYHPALGYFARDYNLNQIAIEDEGKEPSVTHIQQIVELAKKENLKFILVSKEFDTRNAETIARETGAKIIVFNPMTADFPGNILAIAELIAKGNK